MFCCHKNKMYFTWLVLLTAILTYQVESAKILGIFWTFSRSQHLTGSALLKALAESGHEVHLLSSFDDDAKISNFKHELLEGLIVPDTSNLNASMISRMLNFVPILNRNVEVFWENNAVQKLIKTKPKYDAVIVMSFFNDYVLALPHYLKSPAIIYSSISSNRVNNKYVGNPNLIYGRDVLTDAPVTNFFGRLSVTCANIMLTIMEEYILAPSQNEYTKKYLPATPSVGELIKNVSLVLINSHFAIEPPRPYVPNMIQIGGFHSQIIKALPEDLQNYLDSAKYGAVLFSMGTVVKLGLNLRKEHLDIIMTGLRKIAPIKVLFKSEIEIPTAPRNVLVTKWLPQNGILAHPYIKIFISHGGLGSTTEAVYHGVPVLGIPFFSDQKTNIASVARAGFAISLKYDEMTQKLSTQPSENC
ncbi:hypothetical protein HHI36_003570 [Cryptolaemus montrouzieri]|uniref:UDP-glucuronosyltransferase n=1 Tax=Cryptolaemus montrouzieri TaxID=559131 RepID=A0ABD2PDT9_9CUCU